MASRAPELATDRLSTAPGDGQAGEPAPVIPLDPSLSEEGLFDTELLRHNLTAVDPLSVVGGIWRGISHIKDRALGNAPPHGSVVPHRVFVPYGGHEHLLLVTDPDPEMDIVPDEADTAWFKPGLVELGDVGSALRLHIAFAGQHPELRVVTETTKGMSHTGKTVPAAELAGRDIETMAAESLHLMRRVVPGGTIALNGTSLGTRLDVAIAELNLAANPGEQLPITRLNLISSAAVAGKIEGAENFRAPDLDEDLYREELSKRFQHHIPADFIRMLYTHPEDILSCWPMLGAYALAHPGKTHDRIRTMARDYGNVKQGVDWSSLKYVVSGVPVNVLDGERDPLTHEQEPQWEMLDMLFPGQVQHVTVKGMGHLMTAAAGKTVGHLVDMEQTPVALKAA
jgi:hypothetical protein